MYVYSCKSGQMYKLNFLFKLWLPAAWKVHGGPCASVHLAKCLNKSDQMFIPSWQYSISGHDFCGLSFVKECASNPRVLRLFKIKSATFQHKEFTQLLSWIFKSYWKCNIPQVFQYTYWHSGTSPFMVWILGFTQPILMRSQ